MKPAPNPRYDAFLVELQNLGRPFSKWKGLLFRASCLPYAQTAKLLDGKGSLTHGGRWSAAGITPIVTITVTTATSSSSSSRIFGCGCLL